MDTTHEMRNSLGTIKDNVKQSAKDIKRSVERELDSSEWKARYEDMRERADEAMSASSDFIKAHPFYTVLGAACIGVVAGMLMRRR